jgi:hypothetical protein
VIRSGSGRGVVARLRSASVGLWVIRHGGGELKEDVKSGESVPTLIVSIHLVLGTDVLTLNCGGQSLRANGRSILTIIQ